MGLGTFNLPCSKQVLGDVSSGPLNGSNKQESTNNLDNSFELLFIFTVKKYFLSEIFSLCLLPWSFPVHWLNLLSFPSVIYTCCKNLNKYKCMQIEGMILRVNRMCCGYSIIQCLHGRSCREMKAEEAQKKTSYIWDLTNLSALGSGAAEWELVCCLGKFFWGKGDCRGFNAMLA